MEYDYEIADREQLRHVLPNGATTLRVQTIPEVIRPSTLQLLHDVFGAATGVPVLVNTSFNGFLEPIVCSPRDAIRCSSEPVSTCSSSTGSSCASKSSRHLFPPAPHPKCICLVSDECRDFCARAARARAYLFEKHPRSWDSARNVATLLTPEAWLTPKPSSQ